jgi:oligopeptidase A
MLRSKAYPAAQKELEQLTAFARSKGFAEPKLALWDVPFWCEHAPDGL